MRPRQHLMLLAMGALLWLTGPGEGAAGTASSNHWAFQPLAPQSVPLIKDKSRVRNAVDAFVLARLEALGLSLSPAAPPSSLLRRLNFDLTGLPPTPDKLHGAEAFQRFGGELHLENSAIPRLVDRLIASPQFGERWARWWLDAVGYVDVMGMDNDAGIIKLGDGKWRYRDYVVQSLNADKPFDRFLLEQLAGDELAGWRGADGFTEEMRTLLVATGFLRAAPDDTDENELNTPEVHHAQLQQSVENLGQTLLGLTLNCARCHDHKYEPISQADYYGLLAHLVPAFNPAAWLQPKDRVLADLPKPLKADLDRHNAALDKEVEALRQQQQAIRDRYRDLLLEARLPHVPAAVRNEAKIAARTPFEKRTEEQRRLVGRFERWLRFTTDEIKVALTSVDRTEWDRIDREIAAVNTRRKTPPLIHAVYDHGKSPPVHVLRRGEFDKPAQAVVPALPTELRSVGVQPAPPANAQIEQQRPDPSPRLALAQQLTAPDSRAAALVARVIVNRVWQQLFGRGLVETSDNLGVSGARPTHPELLDWLAGEFIRGGWRLKPLVRRIVESSVYQQTASPPAALVACAAKSDPDGHWLWHQRLRRLESEMVRDSLLAVGGQLDLTPGGPPVLTTNLADGSVVVQVDALRRPEDQFRRSLYLLQRRNYHPSLLATFDQPTLNATCSRRSPSAVVSQSLTMLNDAFVLDAARALAARICAAQPDTVGRVAAAFRLALSRPPTATEAKWCREAVEAEGVQRLLAGESTEAARTQAMAHLCHTLLNTSEFLSIP